MSATRSISEIVHKVCTLPSNDDKIAWLKENNTQALRTILAVVYDPDNHQWNIPHDSIPPYTPSPHNESHGMLYRQVRKLRYFIKGYDGDSLLPYRREQLFIELLETVDREDAKLMEQVLLQKPFDGLTSEIIIAAFGPIIPQTIIETPKKKGRPRKNG